MSPESADLNGDGITDKWYWSPDSYAYWLPKQGWSTFNFFENNSLPVVGWIQTSPEGTELHGLNPMAGLLDWHEEDCLAIKTGTGGVLFRFHGFADVNGDGRRDLVVSRENTFSPGSAFDGFFVHLNITSGDPLVADINRDGFVNAQDLGLLIAAWTG